MVVDAQFVFCLPISDGDRPKQIIVDGQPIGGGQGCDGESTVIVGELNSASNHEYDYVKEGETVVYSPQTVPGPSSSKPDPRMLQGLVMTDANISIEAKANLMQYFALLDQNVDNLPGLRSGWQILIAAYGETWLTQDIRALVEGYAVQANMPITQGE